MIKTRESICFCGIALLNKYHFARSLSSYLRDNLKLNYKGEMVLKESKRQLEARFRGQGFYAVLIASSAKPGLGLKKVAFRPISNIMGR